MHLNPLSCKSTKALHSDSPGSHLAVLLLVTWLQASPETLLAVSSSTLPGCLEWQSSCGCRKGMKTQQLLWQQRRPAPPSLLPGAARHSALRRRVIALAFPQRQRAFESYLGWIPCGQDQRKSSSFGSSENTGTSFWILGHLRGPGSA